MSDNKIHRTMIGGQAVIEGVMMRGPRDTALAVRKPDGTINLDVWKTSSVRDRYPILGIPLLRGVVNFVEMLIFGYKTLMKSAEIAGVDEDEPEKSGQVEGSSGVESQTAENEGGISKVAMDALTGFSMLLGFVIAILLFVVAPTFIVGRTNQFVHWGRFETIVEGVIKIAIFVGYLAVIAKMKDIQRVYEYHGAEHKTIYCYEHGEELTPENARKYTRFHPRCGTSFLLVVLVVNILVFSFVTWKVLWLRILLTFVLLPLVVGISYEIIKFAGRHDNSFMRFILAPGLWLQRLTTREPDDSQLEVAIKSIKAVLTDNPEDDRW